MDYVVGTEGRRYYVCPAKRDDRPGRIVTTGWPFLPSSCVFLRNNRCRIEEVKPRGGRDLYCRLMTGSNHDLTGYGKKKAARDWSESPLLIRLVTLAIEKSDADKQYAGTQLELRR